jgi:hypothetical protein
MEYIINQVTSKLTCVLQDNNSVGGGPDIDSHSVCREMRLWDSNVHVPDRKRRPLDLILSHKKAVYMYILRLILVLSPLYT